MRKSMVVVLAVCLNLSSMSPAQPSTSDVLVASTVRDYVDVTDPLTGTTQRIPMQVQSDGAGAYTTVTYKKGYRVKSVIQSIGDWELDTGIYVTSPTRKVFIDFSKPIAGSGPNGGNPTPPFITRLVEGRFISKCHEYGINTLAMADGQTVNCPMTIGFYSPLASSDHYRISMTPDDRSLFSYPETDFLNITCSAVDANFQCNQ